MDITKPMLIDQGRSTGLHLIYSMPDNTSVYSQGYVYGVSPFKFLLAVVADNNAPMTTCLIAIDETLIDIKQKIYTITKNSSSILTKYNWSYRNVTMIDRDTLLIENSIRGNNACIPYRIYGIY